MIGHGSYSDDCCFRQMARLGRAYSRNRISSSTPSSAANRWATRWLTTSSDASKISARVNRRGVVAGVVKDKSDHEHSLIDRPGRRQVAPVHFIDRIPTRRPTERLDPTVLIKRGIARFRSFDRPPHERDQPDRVLVEQIFQHLFNFAEVTNLLRQDDFIHPRRLGTFEAIVWHGLIRRYSSHSPGAKRTNLFI